MLDTPAPNVEKGYPFLSWKSSVQEFFFPNSRRIVRVEKVWKKMNAEQGAERNSAEFMVPEGFQMNGWLLQTNLSNGAKLAYSVLAICCGGRSYAWPSYEYLTVCLSASKRTVQRYLRELETHNFIKIERQYVKGQMRNVYRFLNHAQLIFEPAASASASAAKSDRRDRPTAPEVQPAKVTICPAIPMTEPTGRGDKTALPYNKEESIIRAC